MVSLKTFISDCDAIFILNGLPGLAEAPDVERELIRFFHKACVKTEHSWAQEVAKKLIHELDENDEKATNLFIPSRVLMELLGVDFATVPPANAGGRAYYDAARALERNGWSRQTPIYEGKARRGFRKGDKTERIAEVRQNEAGRFLFFREKNRK